MTDGSISSIHAAVVIAAAGSSSRMGASVRKQYLPLGNGTVLSEAVKPFLQTLHCSILVITIPADEDESYAAAALSADKSMASLLTQTKLIFVHGGESRCASVKCALEAIASSGTTCDIVLVHDAARPFVTGKIIRDAAAAAVGNGASVPAVTPVDTQKETDGHGIIIRHLQRSTLAAVQTPQAFLFAQFLEAHRKAALDGCTYTDDTEIWDKYVGRVVTVPGDVRNRKITFASDMDKTMNDSCAIIHTGLGYDIHPLAAGRKLLLGGIELPFDKGEAGHSDGDVLLHAITDALLGASGLGDIGSFFPPEDDKWKDADSACLLETVWRKVTAAGWRLVNMDCIVKLEQPKFLPYRNAVRSSIAGILRTDSEKIFVKAKTGEKMGDVGQGNAVEAWCSCLLEKP
ncbi:MAG TPA: 2-C-methyl-D-erythritol 2,4-cyclodiphosphate synthase [Treponema sp.]|nr:2-C-methyl-D-erythritol 2,4-cyclodiphosphate synthase [Treponema sp.]